MAPKTERRLAAILAADVVGYSRLVEADEAAALTALKAHRRELIAPVIAEGGGRIFKTTGDGLLVEFPSVVAAVECAVEIQRGMAARNTPIPGDRRVELRIGIHLGDVVLDRDAGGEPDMLGDGVNLAVRLEGLAAPGGICLSHAAFEHVRGPLAATFADLGEQTVKNISRPVRVYAARTISPAETTQGRPAVSAMAAMADPFAGRPAFAVLPLVNHAGDPDTEYFADGITDDLITSLSRWRWFPVLARNSSFAFKAAQDDPVQIGRKLGGRYLLQGGVRRAADRFRITARLVDAETGHQLWADRYESAIDDLFRVQDDITLKIVSAVEPELGRAEQQRAIVKPAASMAAYDCFQRGNWHFYRYNKEDNAEAARLYRRAIELHPPYSAAHSALAYCLTWDAAMGWAADAAAVLDEARALAERAVALDDGDATAHMLLARALLWSRRIEEGLAEAETALRLNPSLAIGYSVLGWGNDFGGRFPDAVSALNRSVALRPHDRTLFRCYPALAIAHYELDQYEAAEQVTRRAAALYPDYWMNNLMLAASLGQQGRAAEAREIVERMRRADPGGAATSPARLVERIPFRDPAHARRIADGLAKAGIADLPR
jgi:adenylate cyclase